MKQLNFFRKFMPSLIVYYLYLIVNETSYMIVKTFTRLHIYRSSSPSDKRGWGRGEGAPFPLRVSICPKIRWGPDPGNFLYATTYRRPPPPLPPLITGVQILPAISSFALSSMPWKLKRLEQATETINVYALLQRIRRWFFVIAILFRSDIILF